LGAAHLSTQSAASFIGQSAVWQSFAGKQKRRLPLLPKKQTSFDILKSEPFVTQQGKPLSSEAMHRVFQQVS
jgi:hypothetical protein